MHKANKILKLALGVFVAFSATEMACAQANNVFQPGTSAITPNTQQLETGPILDVIPYVLADGYTLNLTLIPSLTEFNGYDTAPAITFGGNANNLAVLPVILPDFTVRQVITTVNVWDGQTVVQSATESGSG